VQSLERALPLFPFYPPLTDKAFILLPFRRGRKGNNSPDGQTPRLREEGAAALFWQAGCPFARAWEKLSGSQKIIKIM
jgi:hypothetical protein